MEEQSINKFTVKEILISEYNKHLAMYVANLIEATFTGNRDPNEIVITVIRPSGNPQIPSVEQNIKAKDAQSRALKEKDKQDSILRAIERLIDAENKKETTFK